MVDKRKVLLELDGSDSILLDRVADHLRLPLAYVLRIALRHYVMYGDWPIGTNGYREQVLEEARKANDPKKGKVKA